MTNLSTVKKALQDQIELSLISFAKKIVSPNHERYMFVLEELSTKKVIGASSIDSNIIGEQELLWYKLSDVSENMILDETSKLPYMTLNDRYKGKSEICGLFLLAQHRHVGVGPLLSSGRFMFMKLFPERFSTTIFADMRGFVNSHGNSQFWTEIMEQHFKLDYKTALTQRSLKNKDWLIGSLPKEPIKISDLSHKSLNSMGRPHDSAVSAYKMLQKEGFKFERYVDIFDAGPILEARLTDINTIQNSAKVAIGDITPKIAGTKKLVSNVSLDFKAIFSEIEHINDSTVHIDQESLSLLQITKNDQILIQKLGS